MAQGRAQQGRDLVDGVGLRAPKARVPGTQLAPKRANLTSKVDMVEALGADHVIDYTRDDPARGARYDVVLDTGGSYALAHVRRALTPRGTLVIVGGSKPREQRNRSSGP